VHSCGKPLAYNVQEVCFRVDFLEILIVWRFCAAFAVVILKIRPIRHPDRHIPSNVAKAAILRRLVQFIRLSSSLLQRLNPPVTNHYLSKMGEAYKERKAPSRSENEGSGSTTETEIFNGILLSSLIVSNSKNRY